MNSALCEQRIATLHPALQARAQEHYRIALRNGVPFRVTQAFRRTADQAALYAKGRDAKGNVIHPAEVVTMAPPGRSWHEYALAYDIVLVTPQGDVSWDLAMDGDLDGVRDWQEVGTAGELAGLEWGGRWKRFRDMPHFQLTGGLTYEAAATLVAAGGIPGDYFGKKA